MFDIGDLRSSRVLRISIVYDNSTGISVLNLRFLIDTSNLDNISLFTINGNLGLVSRLLFDDDDCGFRVVIFTDIDDDLWVLAIPVVDNDNLGRFRSTIDNVNMVGIDWDAWLL